MTQSQEISTGTHPTAAQAIWGHRCGFYLYGNALHMRRMKYLCFPKSQEIQKFLLHFNLLWKVESSLLQGQIASYSRARKLEETENKKQINQIQTSWSNSWLSTVLSSLSSGLSFVLIVIDIRLGKQQAWKQLKGKRRKNYDMCPLNYITKNNHINNDLAPISDWSDQ